ncbi:hypothetical protein K3X48_04185 [Aliiroseovarius crassostreae]|uniref:Uncharacterized protein n=1 Tax=Aliiroseovarius crassostreae TaxID=154981 RepID=A0A9Q9LUC9_9RHOB|nr:hypothetical protein [Aliiroseovarius crassostreae]UWP96195.1 hypothetical protein K3X48_04185 [Aliiroseovarius crassostreae]
MDINRHLIPPFSVICLALILIWVSFGKNEKKLETTVRNHQTLTPVTKPVETSPDLGGGRSVYPEYTQQIGEATARPLFVESRKPSTPILVEPELYNTEPEVDYSQSTVPTERIDPSPPQLPNQLFYAGFVRMKNKEYALLGSDRTSEEWVLVGEDYQGWKVTNANGETVTLQKDEFQHIVEISH